jgi:hypothetical protein
MISQVYNHLNKEDKIQTFSFNNNFNNLQYTIVFESGQFIIIDAEIFDEMSEHINKIRCSTE